MSSGSPQITKLLKPMKREGVVPSIKSLNAQINAMMQAIGFIEDEDPRMQFLRRVEVVQADLHYFCSELESHMPRKLKRLSTLNIDPSLHLIGSPEEGYIPLTKKLWQDVMDIVQRIDRLSEGLVLVVQRNHHQQALRSESSDASYPHSDCSCDSDPYDQDMNQIPYSRDNGELDGTIYAFQYSRLTSDGHQAQISYARRYYRPSSNSLEGNQHNQFSPGPNYFNPQLPTNMTTIHCDPFITSPPRTRNHFHGPGYITEHSRDNLGYVPERRHSQGPYMPQPPGPSIWRIPSDVIKFREYSNSPLLKYRSSSLPEYSTSSQRTGARHPDFSHYSQGYNLNRIG